MPGCLTLWVTLVASYPLCHKLHSLIVVLFLSFEQMPVSYNALTYRLDRALKETGEDANLQKIILQATTMDELVALGVSRIKAVKIRGYGVDTSYSVRCLFHAGEYFQQGTITLHGAEKVLDGKCKSRL